MSEVKKGENRRTTTKHTKNGSKASTKKVSTEDKNNSQANVTETKNTKKNKSEGNSQKKEQEKENIFEKIKKLEEELEKKKSEIESKAQIDIDKIKSLNESLSAFAKEKKLLLTKNNKILSEMNLISQDFSKNFSNKKLLKILKKKKLEKNFNFEVYLREKQKKAKKNFININEKEIEKLKKLLEDVTNGENEEKLNADLENLNNEITFKENILEELKKTKKEHEFCEKMISKLNIELNLLKNDIDLKTKIGNMNEAEKIEKKKPTKLKVISRNMEYGEKVRHKAIKFERNKYSSIEVANNYKLYNKIIGGYNVSRNVNKSPLRQTINIADIADGNNNNHNHLKSSADFSCSLNSFQLSMNNKDSNLKSISSRNYLFSQEEKEIMKIFMPERLLTDINERYNNVDNQIKKIEEEKEKEHKGIKNKIDNNDTKIKHLQLQIKEERIKKINKNKKYVDNKKKIQDLQNEIKKISEMITKEEKIYKKKVKSHEKLKKEIENIKINKQKMKEKEDEDEDEDENKEEDKEEDEKEGEEEEDEMEEESDN